MNSNDFNVMDMLDEYSSLEDELDVSDVFKKNPVSGNVKAEAEPEPVVEQPKPKKNGIDPSLVEDMEEFKQPGAVYSKDEIKVGEEPLRNIVDDSAIAESQDALSDLKRKQANIEELKRRHNIQLYIPEGELQVKMLIAASDRNHDHAQQMLDEVLAEIEETYPEMVQHLDAHQESDDDDQEPVLIPLDEQPQIEVDPDTGDVVIDSTDMLQEAKVIIDKQDAPEIAWSKEEAEKIRRARTIELNIVDAADIDFGSIINMDTDIDSVLEQYSRKTNDVVGVLPASKYRATFTGLTYPEVLDLQNSEEVNNLDGERKKWSLCFNHMRNQSIGPWEEYILYKDPTTGKEVKADLKSQLPDGITDADIHYVSKYEDFLRKTSYMDLEFMLWKILCASTLSSEIVSITCRAQVNGKECGHTYDWIYSPQELLEQDSISPAVLEEMRETGEATTMEDILRIYETAPVRSNNFVKLHTSGFIIVYGHISAYDYLEDVYGKLKELEDKREDMDPTLVSTLISSMVLTTVKAVLLPRGDKYMRVTGANDIVKVLQILDEIDWMTIVEINNLMLEPYRFRFSVRNLVCPKCKNRSEVPITSIADLIFIVARSLSSVQVTLKRT